MKDTYVSAYTGIRSTGTVCCRYWYAPTSHITHGIDCNLQQRRDTEIKAKSRTSQHSILIFSMSSDSNSSKLLVTAVGAALGGALVSFAAFKYIAQRKELIKHREALARAGTRRSISMSSEQRSEAVIFPHNHEEKMRRRIAARVAVEEDNLTPRNSVTVRVPATSANLGPGCEFAPCRRNNLCHLFVYSFMNETF